MGFNFQQLKLNNPKFAQGYIWNISYRFQHLILYYPD